MPGLSTLSNAVRGALARYLETTVIVFLRLSASCRAFLRLCFQYRPLAENELRVLTILPPITKRRDEPIRCKVEHVSLDAYTEEYTQWETETGRQARARPHTTRIAWREQNKKKKGRDDAGIGLGLASDNCRYTWGDYIALSYCWGSTEKAHSRTIILNGHYFQVTENLEAALLSVRSSRLGPKKLWVDAICINQNDAAEKIREIRRMKNIYGGSLGVYMHLGPGDEGTDHGVQVLHRVAAQVEESIRHDQCDDLQSKIDLSDAEVLADMDLLLKIFQRPYWRRLWILQELAMSEESSVFGLGGSDFRFNHLVLALKFLWQNIERIWSERGGSVEDMLQLNATAWVTLFIQGMRELSQRLEDVKPVTQAHLQLPLNLSQNNQATLAHDKVFGLLALLPDAVASKMENYYDYSISVETVYIGYAKALMDTTADLDIIFMKNYAQTMTPSWAPDWRHPPDRVSFLHDWRVYGYTQFQKAYPDLDHMYEAARQFRADGFRRLGHEVSADSSTLGCTGIRIGLIDGMAPTGIDHNPVFTTSETIQPKNQNNPYGDHAAVRRALEHTLYANPIWGDTEPASIFRIPWMTDKSYTINALEPFKFAEEETWKSNVDRMNSQGWSFLFSYGNYFSFELFRRILGHLRVAGTPLMEFFEQEIRPCDIPHDRVRLDLAKVVGGHLARRLVVLDTGHVGLAPYTVQQDDVVYVISGCSFPVALRPVGDDGDGDKRFRVLGECYVEGFARGEAMKGAGEGKYNMESISLC